jgi:methylase of polypeptide subunit release factors
VLDAGAVLPGLRDRLRDAGFDAAWLGKHLGVGRLDDVGLLNRAAALERLRDDRTAAAVLARLFYLEGAEMAADLRRVLPGGELERLAAVGLTRTAGGRVAARLRIDPIAGLYLLADRRMERPVAHALRLPSGDAVYPVGSDSEILAELVSAPEGSRVLDLCTGTGVQGLKTAALAREVIGVDVGARAVALARCNAALNSLRNFEARRGDLFAPVAGEQFDVVIANPPFVSSPHRGPAYHCGGPLGDRVLRRVVSGLGPHLRPGGRAFAISHLALRRGESLEQRARPWIADFPGRVLVLLLESGSIVDLAAALALFALERGLRAYARELALWLAYLRRVRIEKIVLVIIAAERGGRRGLEVVDASPRTFPLPLTPPPGERLAAWLSGGVLGGKGAAE